MIKYFSKAFKITNENIILTTPLILFMILIGIYSSIFNNVAGNIYVIVITAITALFMFSAFFGGWFYMIKKAIDLEKFNFLTIEEKTKASFNLFKEIPAGVGEFFLSFVTGIILYLVFFIIASAIFYLLGMHFIGKIDINLADLKAALSSSAALKSFILTLPKEQLMKVNYWYLLFFSMSILVSFITMFWPMEIIIKTKNSFKAFFKSIRFISKNFLATVILFIYVNLINFLVSFIINMMIAIPIKIPFISMIMSLFAMIIYFYFFVYVVVLVFLYYDNENNREIEIRTEISDSIEQNTSSSDSGTDGIGEEQSGDSTSEGN